MDADERAERSEWAEPDEPAERAERAERSAPADEPVLPSVSRDETDEGWGDEAGGRDEDWYRRERPPHHE